MPHPLTSIGLPVYNEEQYIRTVLDSLLAQTYPNLEIIISDNASTDDTESICREYAARDSRVKYFRQPENVGSSLNFNRAFELSGGEYFKWVSGHDRHDPDLIARCVEVLAADSRLSLCYPSVIWEGGHDESGNVDTRGEADPFARLGRVLWGISGGAVYGVFRSEHLRKTLLFERVVAPDVLLLAELSVIGRFARLDGPALVLHRPGDYGEWGVYIGKIFGGTPSPRGLYRRALVRLCRRTGRHFRLRGRLLVYVLSASAFWGRFRWAREGLQGWEKSLETEKARPVSTGREKVL